MKCVSCGAELPEGARFCRECGVPQQPTEAKDVPETAAPRRPSRPGRRPPRATPPPPEIDEPEPGEDTELEPPTRPERPAARRPPQAAPPARTRVGRLLPDDEEEEAEEEPESDVAPPTRATVGPGAEDEVGGPDETEADLEGAEPSRPGPAPRRRPEPRRRPVPSTGPLLPPDEPERTRVPELIVEEDEEIGPSRPGRPRPDPTAEPRPLDPLLVGQPELSEEFIAVPGKERRGGRERRAPRSERRGRRERTEQVVVEEGPTPPLPPGPSVDRNRVAMIVLLVLLVAIVLGVGWFLFLRSDEEPAPPITTPIATVPATPAPTIEPTPEPTPPEGLDDKDCKDFGSQTEAQNFYIESGGPTQDLHRIDPDGNGIACEELNSPSPQPT
jgi:hypothetical protein